jgi:hypothetical protein
MFQMRFGRIMTTAMAPPSQIHGFKKARRCDVGSSPTMMPVPKKPIECLLFSPKPASTPNHSHNFWHP